MEPRSGERVGPYEIITRIGSGGMGQVWRARDTRLKRDVAIKFLPPRMAENEQLLRRLAAEATAVAQLAHPSICRIYDVGDSYLVMELLEGETLAARIARGPMSIQDVLRYGAELTAGLAAAHASEIVHRDLKPGNIMITRLGAKLLDFGLATTNAGVTGADAVTAAMTPLTAEGAVVGTFRYMAPEQLEGGKVDARSDIFALGIVLFEMLTGTHPFLRPTAQAMAGAVLGDEPPSVRQFRDDVPPLLDAIVTRCLARSPSERWQSTADLAAVFQWPISGAVSPTARPVRGRRRLIGALAAVALLVVTGVLVQRWMRAPSVKAPTGPPLVMLVDSTLPERVYSSESRANGATNADDLTDILRDLPITLVKENTNALWSREDQVLKEEPALIISHRSAFAAPESGIAQRDLPAMFILADRRLQSFVGYVGLGSVMTQFIVYSRNWVDVGGEQMWTQRLVARYPHLRGRVKTIHVTGSPEASFRDPQSADRVRDAVVKDLKISRESPRP